MNIFDEPKDVSYDFHMQNLGGVYYVSAQDLLDILGKRAMLSLRASAIPNQDERTSDFHRGIFQELSNLYTVIDNYVSR